MNAEYMGTFTTKYGDIGNKVTFRGTLRHYVLDLLSLLNPVIESDAPRLQFLYFHHVFLDEITYFDELLNYLSRNFRFLSYSEGVEMASAGRIDDKYIVLSSDDGFKNNIEAARVLERYGISACFFVNPVTIGLTDYGRISDFCKRRLNLPAVEFLDWEDIHFLQSSGHEIGSHTTNHLNLAQLSREALEEEIFGSKSILDSYCGEVEHFAFPYGRRSDFSDQALDMVNAANYVSCATGERGCQIDCVVERTGIPVINRDLVIASWPLRHVRYFMNRNMRWNSNAPMPWK